MSGARRVLYIGNFEPAHSTENEVRSSFEALGWETLCAQEGPFARSLGSGGAGGVRADVDLLLYTRTGGLPDAAALELWERFAGLGIPTASLHLDRFYGLASPKGPLQRYAMPASDPMFRCAHVFTPDGDHDEEWERDGVNHHWLPPAIGSSSCWSGTPWPERWPQRVAFVGSRSYHPEWPHRARLIDELRQRFGSGFLHVGGDGDYPGTGHALRGPELHDLYATIPVIVGDSCWVDAKPPSTRYWSDRVYEVWGRGGFLVMPYIEALDEHMGRSMPCWDPWDDFDAMADVVDLFAMVDHPIRQACHEATVALVRGEHTYEQRIREMLDVMGIPA